MPGFTAVAGRLDRVVADRLSLPRADVQRAIAAGRVLVDGRTRPKSFGLTGGERVEIELEGLQEVPAEDGAVPVRYEDDRLLVVAKPAGLVTHPTAARRSGTLVNRLLGMDVALSSVAGPERRGIVHRLDAGTSGLLVIAKDDEAHELLASMLSRHQIERRYLALVRGNVEHDRFAVDAPLGRRGARVIVRQDGGKEAETAFVVRERFVNSTFLEATPLTGRTHQIRVHLSSIGHPILCDRSYGGGGDPAKRLGLLRPFLHAWRLSFTHPTTGTRIEIEEPLPEDLQTALERARAAAA
jgi:23S rRNA pseudouridine1911/1915/1917 synthase